jgi:hypothetical protein
MKHLHDAIKKLATARHNEAVRERIRDAGPGA